MQLRVFCKFTAFCLELRSTFHKFFSKVKQPLNLLHLFFSSKMKFDIACSMGKLLQKLISTPAYIRGSRLFGATILARPFRHYLLCCRLFSAQIVSAPIRCSLTVHLFRVWVSVSKKHRMLAPKRAASKWSRRKVVDPYIRHNFSFLKILVTVF